MRGFIDRVDELEQLDATLAPDSGASVVVIAGTAGVGKTALILHWAHQHRALFPGGQLYVSLRGYDPGDPVHPMAALERFLAALGVMPGAMPAELEARAGMYRSLLAERRVLVVLDNAATVGQVRPLLPGSEDCLVLVSSRSRLSGLVARDGAQRVVLTVLPEPEAIALVRTTAAGYRMPDQEEQIAELARLCGRLPLALRIAAERAAARPHMPLASLIQDLRDESSLWDALSSEDAEEADGVRTVFAWSYRALPTAPARLFRLLGVHPGSEFSTQAVAALADQSVTEARRLLDVLYGAYVIEQTGPDRYQFHDLLRAYASDQAAQHEDAAHRQAALQRVCTWYLHTLHAATAVLNLGGDLNLTPSSSPPTAPQDFSDPAFAMTWIDAETDNLIASARSAMAGGLDTLAWQTLTLLRRPYTVRHPVDDWSVLGEQALAAAQRAGDPVGQIAALVGLGINHRLAQQLDTAVDCHRRALLIENTDPRTDMLRRNPLGLALIRTRQFDAAREVFEQVLTSARQAQDPFWAVAALGNLAETYCDAGDLEQADARITEAFACMPQDYPPDTRAEWLHNQAAIHRERGRTAEAEDAIAQALTIIRGTDLLMEGYLENEHGRILLAADRPGQALEALAHAASIHRRTGTRNREAQALDTTGLAYQMLNMPDEARKFHRQAATIHHDLRDNWNHALALTHLADALDSIGENNQARHFRTEALNLIPAYNDLRAIELRQQLARAVHDPDT